MHKTRAIVTRLKKIRNNSRLKEHEHNFEKNSVFTKFKSFLIRKKLRSVSDGNPMHESWAVKTQLRIFRNDKTKFGSSKEL